MPSLLGEQKQTNPFLRADLPGVQKAVGVVGVWRTDKAAQPFELRYEMVEMTEDFATPEDRADGQPILKLMEEYTRELKDENYLAKYSQTLHPHQAGKDPTGSARGRVYREGEGLGHVAAGAAVGRERHGVGARL